MILISGWIVGCKRGSVREGVLSDFEKEDDPWTFEKEDE
jgi:hypothetical protein